MTRTLPISLKSLAIAFVCMMMVACNKPAETPTTTTADSASAETQPDGPVPAMTFETTEHDFGAITEGDVVEFTYNFKNTGEAPLIIQDVKGSCGCTVPEWTKEPVPVGGSGFIKAKFDSKGKHDQQNKTVTIFANTYPPQTILHFKAVVNAKAETKE